MNPFNIVRFIMHLNHLTEDDLKMIGIPDHLTKKVLNLMEMREL